MEGFWLKAGDRVEHIKEPGFPGTVIEIDLDCYPLHVYGVTTCCVRWDDAEEGEEDAINWTNKLAKVEE